MSTTSQEQVASSAMEVDGVIDHWSCEDIWHCPKCQAALRHDEARPRRWSAPGAASRSRSTTTS